MTDQDLSVFKQKTEQELHDDIRAGIVVWSDVSFRPRGLLIGGKHYVWNGECWCDEVGQLYDLVLID
jgi:hypothetical protein